LKNQSRGVFIVELIGGGLSTRVLIRKGSLSIIQQSLKGVMKLYIVNEEKEICIEKTSLLYKDQLYKASKEDKGKILIPMEKSNTLLSEVILINGDFSSIAKIEIPAEHYNLKLTTVYNEERVLPGTLAEFIILPEIECAGQRIALSHLKEAKVIIDCKNHNGVSTQEVITGKDIDLSQNKDIVINYLIPPKTNNLTITFSGKLKDINNKDVLLSQTDRITTNSAREEKNISTTVYLRNTKEGYIAMVMGKAGDPIAKLELVVGFKPTW